MEDYNRYNQLRYALELQYDGSDYFGYQSQVHGNTVQQKLEERMSLMLKHPVRLMGCGRTDTGVHARYFVAHFDTDLPVGKEQFLFRLNQCLPPDISVLGLRRVNHDFHARFKATARKYEYHINTAKDSFAFRYGWFRYGRINVELMNRACEYLLTCRNFQCFSKVRTNVKHFECDLMECYWEQRPDKLVFHVKANRFLRNMVRAMVGTLLRVGYLQMDLEELKQVVESRKRTEAGNSVPGKGLFLTEVHYEWPLYEINE